MKKLILAAMLFAAPLQAQVLTFEDIPSAAPFGSLNPGFTPYSPLGLSFDGWCFSRGAYPAVSGIFTLYNSDGCTVGAPPSTAPTITSASIFGVSSVWLRDFDGTPFVTFNGYLAGNLVATQNAVPAAAFAQVAFGAGFSNIDTFEMTLDDGSFAFIDDLEVIQASTVPEPSALLLMGAGLAGVLAFRRRRNNA